MTPAVDVPHPPIELNNPRILVRDFSRSFAFYTKTLGLTPVFGDGTPPYAEVGDKTHFVGLFSRAEMNGELGPPIAAPDRTTGSPSSSRCRTWTPRTGTSCGSGSRSSPVRRTVQRGGCGRST